MTDPRGEPLVCPTGCRFEGGHYREAVGADGWEVLHIFAGYGQVDIGQRESERAGLQAPVVLVAGISFDVEVARVLSVDLSAAVANFDPAISVPGVGKGCLSTGRPSFDLPASTLQLLAEWRIEQIAQNLSERTTKERHRVVCRLGEHSRKGSEQVGRADIMAFLASIPGKRARSAYFAIIRSWCQYLCSVEFRTDDPTNGIKTPRHPKGEARPISSESLVRLLNGRMYARTRAMITLAAYAGLRVHEIAKIRGEDVDLLSRTLFVDGKGGRRATLPLHPAIADVAATMPRSGWWFPARYDRTGPMLGRSVSTLIGNAMRRNEIPGTAHQLRHWFGTELVGAGANLRVTQSLLRHESMATTQIYVAVSSGEQRAAINRLDPGRT
ncbi:MAG: tyrosine-type recombinase/integrase [Nakamurella sp.]